MPKLWSFFSCFMLCFLKTVEPSSKSPTLSPSLSPSITPTSTKSPASYSTYGPSLSPLSSSATSAPSFVSSSPSQTPSFVSSKPTFSPIITSLCPSTIPSYLPTFSPRSTSSSPSLNPFTLTPSTSPKAASSAPSTTPTIASNAPSKSPSKSPLTSCPTTAPSLRELYIDTNVNVSSIVLNQFLPYDITFKNDSSKEGTLYAVCADHRIRKIDLNNMAISIVAGTGSSNTYYDGAATYAQFYYPRGVDYDTSTDTLYIADTYFHRIRRLTLSNQNVYLVAGLSTSGIIDGVASSTSRFYYPWDLAVYKNSTMNDVTIYVADCYNHRLRSIFWKVSSSRYHTDVVSGTGSASHRDGAMSIAYFYYPRSLTVDQTLEKPVIYVADSSNHVIRKVDVDAGWVTTLAGVPRTSGSVDGDATSSRFNNPQGIALDLSKNPPLILVSDTSNHNIRGIDEVHQTVMRIAGIGVAGQEIDGFGYDARLYTPYGLAVPSTTFHVGMKQYFYVADYNNQGIRKIQLFPNAPTSSPASIAPTSTMTPTTTPSARGWGVRFDSIDVTTPVPSAMGTGSIRGVCVNTEANMIYMSSQSYHRIYGYNMSSGQLSTIASSSGSPGSYDGSATYARFYSPYGMEMDAHSGAIFVADINNHKIRRIDLVTQTVDRWAGSGSSGYFDGFGTFARFSSPYDVAVYRNSTMSQPVVYVADRNNHRIRVVHAYDREGIPSRAATKEVNLVAGTSISGRIDGACSLARFYYPGGLAADSSPTASPKRAVLYVADTYSHVIRMIDVSVCEVTTVAGIGFSAGTFDGSLASARFSYPEGIVVDSTRDPLILYVAEYGGDQIRSVDTSISGRVETVAGYGTGGGPAIDGVGYLSRFNNPYDLALDPRGSRSLYVADYSNSALRRLSFTTKAPVTLSPITSNPSSFCPTGLPTGNPSISPSSVCPSTACPSLSPTTCAPSTRQPSTAGPVTYAPTTDSPTTICPTQTPSTESPATGVPLTEAPTTCHPTEITMNPTATRNPSSCAPSLSPTQPLDPPRVERPAQFSDTLRSLEVTFSGETNTPSGCISLLATSTLSTLGLNPTCSWTTRTTLSIEFGIDWNTSLEDYVTFLPNVIQSSDGLSSFMASISVAIIAPNDPYSIRAILTAPAIVGACNKFNIHTGLSTGNAGRPFSYSWQYISGGTSQLASFVATSFGSSIDFDSRNITVGSHVFKVKIKNWLGVSAEANATVEKVANMAPVVQASTGTVSQIRSTEEFRIAVQVISSNCNGSNVGNAINFGKWRQVFSRDPYISTSVQSEINSLTLSKAIIHDPTGFSLYFAPNTLLAGHTYGFMFTARSYQASLLTLMGEGNSTLIVKVKEPDVVGIIEGGSSRLISVISNAPTNIVVNASKSHDPLEASAILSYSWNVSIWHPNGTIGPVVQNLDGSTSESLSFQSTLLMPNRLYRFSVVVSGVLSYSGSPRTATAVQVLETVNIEVPLVQVSYLGNKVDPTSKVVIKGIILDTRSSGNISHQDAGSSTTYLWTCTSTNLDFTQKGILRSAINSTVLVLAPNALNGGVAYTFQLSVTNGAGVTGRASVTMTANLPPTLGKCGANPSAGVALEDTFRLECSGWVDEDLPIMFKFQIITFANGGLVDLSGFGEMVYRDTTLPTPAEGTTLSLRTIIRDSLGASSSAYYNATVTESASFNITNSRLQMESSLGNKDTQKYSVILIGIAAYLKKNGTETNGSSVTVTEARNTRNTLIKSVQSLLENTDGSRSESVVIPAALVRDATDYTVGVEMTTESRVNALNIVENISNSLMNDFSDEVVVSSVGALGNILGSTVDSLAKNSERETISRRVETLLTQITAGVLKKTVVGEDPTEVITERINLVSQLLPPVARATIVKSTSGAEIDIPQSLGSEVNGNSPVEISLGFIATNPYPSDVLATGIVTLSVKKNGVSIGSNAALISPLRVLLPVTVNSHGSRYCRYWDTKLNSWSLSGVRTLGEQPNGQWCETDHLTAFNVAQLVPTASPTRAPSLSPVSRSPTINGETFEPTLQPTAGPVTSAPTETPPEPLSAQITSSLAGIEVFFNAPTSTVNRTCSGLLDSATVAKLGTGPECIWKRASVLTINFGLNPTLVPGDTVSVLGGIITTPSGNPAKPTPTTVSVSAPTSPVPIQVSLVGPDFLGTCGQAVLTASTSGSGGRDVTFSWSYTAPTGVSGNFSSLVNLVGSSTSASLTLRPSQLLVASHNFTVIASNWIGSQSTASWVITRLESIVPRIESSSPVLSMVDRDKAVSLLVRVSLPNCNDPTQTLGLTTNGFWSQAFSTNEYVSLGAQQYKSTFSSDIITIPKANSLTLNLPKDTLKMGERYGFNFRGIIVNANGQLIGDSNSTFVFDVNVENVVSEIIGGGGAVRMVPVIPTATYVVSFDASGSNDPSNATFKLGYLWNAVDPLNRAVNLPADIATAAILYMNTSLLKADTRYTVSVIVTGQNIKGSTRTASAFQILETVSIEIPIVSVESKVKSRLNSGSRLPLTAEVQNFKFNELSYLWSTPTGNLDFSDPSTLLTSNSEPNLVIAPGILRQGTSYTVKITVTAIATGSSGSATLDFTINGPPSLGACQASPPTGDALLTYYRLECIKWADPEGDLPITYKFQADPSGTGYYIDLSTEQTLDYFETILPAPNANGAVVNLRTIVKDSLGAAATSQFSAIVNARTIDVNDASNSVNDLITKGDLATSGVLLSGIVDQVSKNAATDSSEDSAAQDSEQSSRARVVSSLTSFVSTVTNLRGSAESLGTPSILLQQATKTVNPGGISPGSSSQALKTANAIINVTGFAGTPAPKSIVGVLGNLILAAGGRNNESDVIDTVTKAQAASANIGATLLDGALTGEKQREVISGNFSVVSRRLGSREITSGSGIRSSSGTALNLSESLKFRSSGVDVLTSFSVSPTYPSNDGAGVFSVILRTPGSTADAQVSNLSQPITFIIPARAEINSCVYWNETIEEFTSDGLVYLGRTVTTTGLPAIKCQSSHLTSFSGSTEIQISINTFSASDINARSFSMSNPVMIICFVIFTSYIFCSYLAIMKDRKTTSANESDAYWRETNMQDIISKRGNRSLKNLSEKISWSIRNEHIWLSPVFRHPGDFLSSWKRVTILFVLLFNQMLVTALLVGREQKLPFLDGLLAATIVTTILSIPIPFVVSVLYSRNPPEAFKLGADVSMLVSVFSFLCTLCAAAIPKEEEEVIESEKDVVGAANTKIIAMDEDDLDWYIDRIAAEKEAYRVDADFEVKKKRVKMMMQSEQAANVMSADHALVAVDKKGHVITKSEMAQKKEKEKAKKERMKKRNNRGKNGENVSSSNLESIEISDIDVGKKSAPFDEIIENVVTGQEGEAKACYGEIFWKAKFNHQMTVSDIFVTSLLILFMVGAWFILAALSLTPGFNSIKTVLGSILVFIENFFGSLISMVLLQIILFIPLCNFMNRWLSKDEETVQELDGGFYIHFESGKIGFSFHKLKVVEVRQGTQAAQKGVKVGWRVISIAGIKIKNDRQLFAVLQEQHRLQYKFEMKFLPLQSVIQKSDEGVDEAPALGHQKDVSYSSRFGTLHHAEHSPGCTPNASPVQPKRRIRPTGPILHGRILRSDAKVASVGNRTSMGSGLIARSQRISRGLLSTALVSTRSIAGNSNNVMTKSVFTESAYIPDANTKTDVSKGLPLVERKKRGTRNRRGTNSRQVTTNNKNHQRSQAVTSIDALNLFDKAVYDDGAPEPAHIGGEEKLAKSRAEGESLSESPELISRTLMSTGMPSHGVFPSHLSSMINPLANTVAQNEDSHFGLSITKSREDVPSIPSMTLDSLRRPAGESDLRKGNSSQNLGKKSNAATQFASNTSQSTAHGTRSAQKLFKRQTRTARNPKVEKNVTSNDALALFGSNQYSDSEEGDCKDGKEKEGGIFGKSMNQFSI